MTESQTTVQQDTDAVADADAGADTNAGVTGAVGEARKYRKRAQAAEQSLSELQQQMQEKTARLGELEQTVADLERKGRVDQLLVEAEAIDLESARLLTAMAIDQMDQPDADEAVAELRRRKPFLFRSQSRTSGALSARQETSPASSAADRAADEAHCTGNRSDLLRYLRLKRSAR